MKTNFLVASVTLALAINTHASISEPPNIFYGDVFINNERLTQADTHYTVLAKLNDEVLDRYTMGSTAFANADKYIIRIPVKTIDDGSALSAHEGDLVDFYVSTPSTGDVWIASATVGTRGLIRDLQLGTVDNESNGLAANTDNCADNGSTCASVTNVLATTDTVATPQNLVTSAASLTTVENDHTDIAQVSSTAVMLTAWVGSHDTQVNLPESVLGFEFYRSRDPDCPRENYISCTHGQMDMVTGVTINDTAADLQQPGYYQLHTHGLSSSLTLDPQAPFAVLPSEPESIVSFNDKLWLIAANPEGDRKLLWSSSDGIDWEQQTVTDFLPNDRQAYGFVNFADRLWLIAGTSDDGQLHNDIWSSADGIHWQEEREFAEFSPRENPQLMRFNDQLWLLGGRDDNGTLSDLWSSDDGQTWQQRETPDVLSDRVDYQVLSFNDRLWLIGGEEDGEVHNDIWSSADGKQWTQQTVQAEFSPSSEHRLTHFDNKLWLIGDWDGENDVNALWSSVDGVHWSESENPLPFSLPHNQHLLVLDEQLWVIGAKDSEHPYEVWSSNDGVSWRKGVRDWFLFN